MSIFGFPHHTNIAPTHERYVGLYHYSGYYRSWDKIIAIEDGKWWIVREVDLDGNFIGPIRKHISAMHADMFADYPFNVTSEHIAQCKG